MFNTRAPSHTPSEPLHVPQRPTVPSKYFPSLSPITIMMLLICTVIFQFYKHFTNMTSKLNIFVVYWYVQKIKLFLDHSLYAKNNKRRSN